MSLKMTNLEINKRLSPNIKSMSKDITRLSDLRGSFLEKTIIVQLMA